ncbi:hypothetical protein [Gordonia sp. SMJS1]|uniref:hypothetical protein n=1 Tax=Gordonia sp. SMJS1 TaxID=3039400 RepID=UPI002454565E|nr:hypothetical protein [Gordonia sp. SMJS1]WGJ88143.1 hypothetical protein QAD21_23990 [Gordonia sp. SMJS1]
MDSGDVVPAPSARTVAARAADIVAVERDSVDAVAEAVAELPSYVSEVTRWDIVAAVEGAADSIARKRRPLLGEVLGPGPVPWACWQGELVEPWPILADAAARLGSALPSRHRYVGHWSVTTD